MAREVDLKVLKIELKVSSNCCKGCENKVKKALRDIEGILKTDIDPRQPKVTVLGNVNPQILIKRLRKVGKHAELGRFEELRADKKGAETIAVAKGKEQENNGWKQEEQSDTCEYKTQKVKDITEGREDGGQKKDTKRYNNDSNTIPNASNPPQDLKNGNSLMPHPEVGFMVNPAQNLKKELPPVPRAESDFMDHPHIYSYSEIKSHQQHRYIAQPCPVDVPYYTIPSYAAAPQPPTCVEVHYHYSKPRVQPPFSRPMVQVEDYFSDENTMGCHVM